MISSVYIYLEVSKCLTVREVCKLWDKLRGFTRVFHLITMVVQQHVRNAEIWDGVSTKLCR